MLKSKDVPIVTHQTNEDRNSGSIDEWNTTIAVLGFWIYSEKKTERNNEKKPSHSSCVVNFMFDAWLCIRFHHHGIIIMGIRMVIWFGHFNMYNFICAIHFGSCCRTTMVFFFSWYRSSTAFACERLFNVRQTKESVFAKGWNKKKAKEKKNIRMEHERHHQITRSAKGCSYFDFERRVERKRNTEMNQNEKQRRRKGQKVEN